MEQTYLEGVAMQQLDSGFNRAFKNEDYVAYSAMNVYLNDNASFIDRPKGNSTYIATVRNNGKDYAVRFFTNLGIYYIDNNVDTDFKVKLSFNASSHDVNYILAGVANPYVSMLKSVFEHGLLRFKNQECKSAFFDMLRYQML